MESNAATTPADNAARSPSAVLLTTAAIYLPLFALSWLVFEVLRRRKQQLFEPVNHFAFPADKRTKWFAWVPFVLSISDNDIFEKCGLDAWVFLRFIRIGQKVALLCVVSSFALFPIYAWTPLALPVQSSAPTLNETVVLAEGIESFAELLVHVDWIDRITLSNVGPGDWRMIFTVLSAYAITFYVMHLLIFEYNLYRKRRHAFLAKKDAQQYTIVVSDLPFALRRPQTLMAYMDYLFPGTVYSVYIGVECERLEKLVDERTQLQYRLEAAESDLHDAEVKHKTALEDGKVKDEPVARPHHKVDYKFLGMCCGKDVDSIDYYRQEIQRLTQEIVSVRKSILDDQFDPIKESKPQYGTMGTMPKWTSLRNLEQKLALTLESSTSVTSGEKQPLLKSSSVQGKDDAKVSSSPNVMRSCAFVSFRSLRSAQAAQQLLQTENPIKMRIQPAPHIDDVQWENFGLPQSSKSTWVLISAFSTLLIVLFWTIPTAFVTSLAKPENLRQMSSFAGHLLDTQPWLTQLLEQLTPLILSLMNSLSNVVFKMLATREGHLSLTEVDASLFSKLNSFQVVQMFFVSTVTGSILAQVAAVVEQPSRIVFFLGSSIASQSLFFITFIITQIAVNLPMMLLRVTPILMGTLHSIFAPTYAKKPVPQPWLFLTPLNYESELEAPFSLAQQYLIFLLVIVFAPIAPLVGYAGMLFFVSSELIYKRFFFFVNQPKWNTQNSMGAFWQPLFSFILGALLMAQITLIGLLSLKPAGYTVIVLSVGLPCCTFLFYWYSMTLFNFPRAADYLPLDQCCDVDDERTSETFTFLDGVYQQPAMAKAYSDSAASDTNAHIDSTGGSVASQPPPSLAATGHESSLAALNAAGDSDAEAAKALLAENGSGGGVAHRDELSGFFQRRPEVLEVLEVLAAGASSHPLKKIVHKADTTHGLFWRDDNPQSRERELVVGHVVMEEQRKRGAFESEV